MPQVQKDLVPEDEIDFGKLGRRIGFVLGYPFRLFRRHPLITLFFLLAALAIAVAGKFFIPRQYESAFIIKPTDRNERFHLAMLGDLETLRRQSDHQAICRLLQVTDEVGRSLGALKSHNPFLKNRSDSINYTIVTLSSTRPENLPLLQAGILLYLESNPYFAKISALQRAQVDAQLRHVDRDLMLLDSLKLLQSRAELKAGAGSVALLENLADKSRVYTVGAERMQKKTALMAQQQFLDNFQLVKPLVVPAVHSSPPRILVMLCYTVPASLLLCFVFLVLFERARPRNR